MDFPHNEVSLPQGNHHTVVGCSSFFQNSGLFRFRCSGTKGDVKTKFIKGAAKRSNVHKPTAPLGWLYNHSGVGRISHMFNIWIILTAGSKLIFDLGMVIGWSWLIQMLLLGCLLILAHTFIGYWPLLLLVFVVYLLIIVSSYRWLTIIVDSLLLIYWLLYTVIVCWLSLLIFLGYPLVIMGFYAELAIDSPSTCWLRFPVKVSSLVHWFCSRKSEGPLHLEMPRSVWLDRSSGSWWCHHLTWYVNNW